MSETIQKFLKVSEAALLGDTPPDDRPTYLWLRPTAEIEALSSSLAS